MSEEREPASPKSDPVWKLVDPMQGAIDQGHFADARHILAVKR